MTRLPTPGGDTGNWGTILNEYLLTAHSDDGSLKSGIVAGGNIADGAVTTDALADASVTMDKLASSLQTTLSSVVASSMIGKAGGIASLDSSGKVPASQLPVMNSDGTVIPDASASTKGIIQLAGDLSGSASSPKVVGINGVAVSGTPSAGQALVATGAASAGWSTVSGGGGTPLAGTGHAWNTTTDPSTGATADEVGSGDIWNDSTSDSANILTKAWINGQWVVLATTPKPTGGGDPDPDPDPTTPDAPTNVTATAGDGEATISFDGSAGATSYTVTSSPGGITATGTTPPITVSGLTNGTEYTFTVTASNAAGVSGESDASGAVTPMGVEPEPANEMKTGSVWPLRVEGHYLVDANGDAFMWQGDIAWALCCQLKPAEVTQYLDTRKAQGYTVIQMLPFFWVKGYNQTNYNGDPMFDGDFPNFNENYMKHVDWVIDEIEKRGMYCAFFAVWSVMYANETNPHKLTANNSAGVGTTLGTRYKNKKLIWVMGGDCGYFEQNIWNPMASAITQAVTGGDNHNNIMMTFHPGAKFQADVTENSTTSTGSSAPGYHNESWLDFNMAESTHCDDAWRPRSHEIMEQDYARTPVKPCIDAESTYEDHPKCWDPSRGYFTDFHARSANWTAALAGAFGFTYGHNSIWPFAGGSGDNMHPQTWQEGLERPGGKQMQYLTKLIASRPILSRVPDQSIIKSDQGCGWTRKQAMRGQDGSYLYVYNSDGAAMTIDTTKLSSSNVKIWWYNPRTGESTSETRMVSGNVESTYPD